MSAVSKTSEWWLDIEKHVDEMRKTDHPPSITVQTRTSTVSNFNTSSAKASRTYLVTRHTFIVNNRRYYKHENQDTFCTYIDVGITDLDDMVFKQMLKAKEMCSWLSSPTTKVIKKGAVYAIERSRSHGLGKQKDKVAWEMWISQLKYLNSMAGGWLGACRAMCHDPCNDLSGGQ